MQTLFDIIERLKSPHADKIFVAEGYTKAALIEDLQTARKRPEVCPCQDEKPDPCPACGATVSGADGVRGVCQAERMHSGRRYPVGY